MSELSQNLAELSQEQQTMTITKLRQRLLAQCPDLTKDSWWLLGTSGCHLCEVAESLIKQLQLVTPITYQLLDITDLDDATMADFAAHIPVVITPTARLDYPFSVLDLQRLQD